MAHKVLIIDDDVIVHKLVMPLLTREGYEGASAFSGEEGLAMAVSWQPDLIVLDVIMPGMKGRDVCAKLKSNPVTEEIPVIFLTAKNSPDDVEAELNAGGITHLPKPIARTANHIWRKRVTLKQARLKDTMVTTTASIIFIRRSMILSSPG